MKTSSRTTDRNSPPTPQYALRRGVGYWAVAFEGREAMFKHELGALYVAHLLLNPPLEPIHAVALALKARERAGQVAEPDEVFQERGVQAVTAAITRCPPAPESSNPRRGALGNTGLFVPGPHRRLGS
jgi:hypothetical protein